MQNVVRGVGVDPGEAGWSATGTTGWRIISTRPAPGSSAAGFIVAVTFVGGPTPRGASPGVQVSWGSIGLECSADDFPR